jgi:succinoglycan biosynthesis transport protein ExoP
VTEPMLPILQPDGQMSVSNGEGPPKGSSIRMGKFLAVLLKRWWIPVLTVALSLGATAAYVVRKPPTFVSSARMWETEKMRLPVGELFSEDMATFLGSQTELLQSGKLRQLTLARLRAKDANSVPVGADGYALPVAIRVWQAAKSSVFVLEATSSQGAYTQFYLNALMDVYLEYRKDVRKTVSGDALASIMELVQKWQRDVTSAQDILTAFERTNNLSILQEEGTVAGGHLAQLETQLSDLQLEDRLLNATNGVGSELPSVLSPIHVGGANSTSAKASSASQSDNSAALQELALLKIQRAKLAPYLRAKHPKMVKIDADIQRAETVLEMFRQQNRDRLAEERQAIKVRIENMIPLIDEWRAKVVQVNGLIAEADRLKLNVERVQNPYERLVSMVQNVGISREIDPENISILEAASPAYRSFHEEESNLTQAGLGGLALGLGIVFLIAYRDDRFTSIVEIREMFGDAVVGQLPELPVVKRDATLPLLESNDQRHAFAEAYRGLRSALTFVPMGDERPRCLLITSAMPNEGKSTVAANLARTLALGGSRVVLVDADLRRGVLHKLLRLQRAPGLSELLWQAEDLEKVIQKDTLPNLSFIPCGFSLSHPGDLLLGPKLDQILTRLRQQFDYVLIDSSPVFAADDAASLAPKVDGALFVVRSGFSSARVVEEAVQLLTQRRAKILGLVFNRSNASARSYYYYNLEEYFPSTPVA